MHFVRRVSRIYYRRRVPESLRAIIGRTEVWRSLGTDSLTVATRRSHQVAAMVEREFEEARRHAGLEVDQTILASPRVVEPDPLIEKASCGITLRHLYDGYMAAPTRDWSPRTRLAYETTRKLVLAILGEHTPVRSITRAQCRETIETLRWLPRNSSKLYPGLAPVAIAAKAKAEGRTDVISPSNPNTARARRCADRRAALEGCQAASAGTLYDRVQVRRRGAGGATPRL